VLWEDFGKICYVYVDDVIKFSESETEHVRHIDIVLKRLLDANMRVAREKTKFFKESVEFLFFFSSSLEEEPKQIQKKLRQ